MSRFVTDSGAEVPGVTATQMRELDRIAVQETGPSLVQMMENAGGSLAELALLPELPTRRSTQRHATRVSAAVMRTLRERSDAKQPRSPHRAARSRT